MTSFIDDLLDQPSIIEDPRPLSHIHVPDLIVGREPATARLVEHFRTFLKGSNQGRSASLIADGGYGKTTLLRRFGLGIRSVYPKVHVEYYDALLQGRLNMIARNIYHHLHPKRTPLGQSHRQLFKAICHTLEQRDERYLILLDEAQQIGASDLQALQTITTRCAGRIGYILAIRPHDLPRFEHYDPYAHLTIDLPFYTIANLTRILTDRLVGAVGSGQLESIAAVIRMLAQYALEYKDLRGVINALRRAVRLIDQGMKAITPAQLELSCVIPARVELLRGLKPSIQWVVWGLGLYILDHGKPPCMAVEIIPYCQSVAARISGYEHRRDMNLHNNTYYCYLRLAAIAGVVKDVNLVDPDVAGVVATLEILHPEVAK